MATRGQMRRAERRETIARARGRGSEVLGQDFQGAMGQHAQGYEQARGMQQGMYDRFGAMAAGRGPSLAQAQLAQATQQNVADQMAMQAAGRGGNLAAASRGATMAGAAQQSAAAQQAAALRSQEQMAAMGAQSQIADQMAGQGLQGQQAFGDLAGQQQLGNRQLDQQHMNIVHGMFRMGGGGGGGGGILSDERVKQNVSSGRQPVRSALGQIGKAVAPGFVPQNKKDEGGGEGEEKNRGKNIFGNIFGAVMSDERAKMNARAGGLAASQAVGELEPKTYEYRPGYGEPGQRVGVMAQALERTPAGQAIVQETPLGKTVDVGGMSSLALAASSDQEHRLRDIEKALGLSQSQKQQQAGSRFKPINMGGA